MVKKEKTEESAKPVESKKPERDKESMIRARNALLCEKAKTLFQSAFESRDRYDWEWLSRDLFRRGYQFSTYDSGTKTVLLSTRKGTSFPINLVGARMRVVRNQVTGFKPKWEVLPSGKNEEAFNNARYSGRLLDYYYDKFDLRTKIKETVTQGLMFSVGGPWQIGFDPNADRGNGEVYIWLLDPYDFYIDPYATSLEEAEYCIKTTRKNIEEINTNPNYKFYDRAIEEGDSAIAASPSKQFLLQALKQRSGEAKDEEEEGVILKEAWIKVRVSEENIDDLRQELNENDEDSNELQIGEVLMRVVHFIEQKTDPLLVQLKRTDEFPFVLYRADLNPGEIYGESWIKHLIPINRVLNALEASVFNYHYLYAIGRIVIDKNSGVRQISNQHGSFIEKNRGAEVSSLPLQSLPNSYPVQISNCIKYIEDLSGVHDISMGRLPVGVTSGVAIAELKQSDSTNSGDLVDNLEVFLVQVAKKVLKEIANNYDVPKVIKDLGLGGEIKHFAVVGEEAAKSRKNKREVKVGADILDLAVIGADNEIRVTVGSWLAYTKSARQERIKELYEAGLIDQKTALEHLEFSDVDNIISSVRKEELLKKFRGDQAKGTEEQVSDEEIARQENTMITYEGRDIEPLVTDNHSIHLIVHQEAMGQMGNPLLEKHMGIHEQLSEKWGPAGKEESTAQEIVGERVGEVPPVGSIPTPGAATTVAGAGQEVAATPTQGMPEEQALTQVLAEMGGGV